METAFRKSVKTIGQVVSVLLGEDVPQPAPKAIREIRELRYV